MAPPQGLSFARQSLRASHYESAFLPEHSQRTAFCPLVKVVPPHSLKNHSLCPRHAGEQSLGSASNWWRERTQNRIIRQQSFVLFLQLFVRSRFRFTPGVPAKIGEKSIDMGEPIPFHS